VYLQYSGHGRGALIANADAEDLWACSYVHQDPDTLGIQDDEPKRPVILAVKQIKNLIDNHGANANTLSKDNIFATMRIQALGFATPDADQIGLVAHLQGIDVEFAKLAAWKIHKERAHPGYVPGGFAKFIRADDGTAGHHAEFQIMDFTAGGLTANARIVGDLIKVDPGTLGALPNGGMPGPNQLYTFDDLANDGGNVDRVTLTAPDRK